MVRQDAERLAEEGRILAAGAEVVERLLYAACRLDPRRTGSGEEEPPCDDLLCGEKAARAASARRVMATCNPAPFDPPAPSPGVLPDRTIAS